MILILIILIITQQNSPKTRYFLFTSNKTLVTIKLGRITVKEIILIATIHFPPRIHPLFVTHTLFFRLIPSHQQSVEICVYIYKDACQCIRRNTYLCTHEQQHIHKHIIIQKHTNLGTHRCKYPPLFEQNSKHINRSCFINFTQSDECKMYETQGHRH